MESVSLMRSLSSVVIKFGFLLLVFLVLESRLHALDSRTGISDECYDALHDEEIEVDPAVKEKCLSNYITTVVTASRVNEDLKNAAAPVSLVSQDDIQKGRAESVAEILRDVPGVDITDAGQAGIKRIRIRGAEARRIAILIDGQEFVDHREVGTPLLIAPEMIERIEVVKGSGSVLHGSRAVGGVINIITKKGGYHPIQGTASSSYDTATNGFQHFASVFGSKHDFDYRFSVSKADHNDRDTPDGELENTSYESESASFYVAKRIDNHTLAVSYDNYNSSSEVYVNPIVATTPPFTDFRIDAPERDRDKLAVSYDWEEVSDSLKRIHLDAYHQTSDRKFNTFTDMSLDVGFPLMTSTSIFSTSTLKTNAGNLQTDWQIGDSHSLIFGVELKEEDLSQDRLKQVTSNGTPSPDELVRDEGVQDSYEVFVQDQWNISEGWDLTAGARSYWLDTELEGSTRPGLAPNSSSDNEVIGSIALAFTQLKDTTIWTRFSQGYNYPTLINLTTGAIAGPDYVNPNPDLESETSDTADLGVRYSNGALSLDFSGFYTESEDLIDHVLCSATSFMCLTPSDPDERVYTNIDEATSYGAEGSASYDFGVVEPYVSAAWLRRKFESSGASTYNTGLPTLSTRSGVKVEKTFQPNINAWLDFYLRAATDSDEIGRRGTVQHKAGWATTNAALGLDFGNKRQYKLALVVENLGDKKYTTATENLLARGRSALIRFTATL